MSSVRPDLKFSDDRDQSSFYKKYLSLSEKPQRTMRIVDKGEYYIVLDSDAELVADLIYKTQSVLKTARYLLDQNIQYLTLSPAVFANLLKIVVLELGYKLEIYDKNWNNCKCASPGNLAEIDDFVNTSELSSVSIIGAIKLANSTTEGKKIGFSFYDPNSKLIGLVEFVDNDLFTQLESLLIQLGVKECLVPALSTPDPDFEKVKELIDRCDIVISECKQSEFSDKNIEQDLISLTGSELILSTNELSSLKIALACSNSLISYLSLLSDDLNRGAHTVEKYNLGQYMRLDYAAVRALNIFPPPNYANSMNKTSSLFGLLNHCKTIGGSRLLSQWLKQPLVDADLINERQLIVKHFIEDMNGRLKLQNSFLNEVPDITKLIKKMSMKNRNITKLDDVIRLYQLCVKLPEAIAILKESSEETTSEIEEEAMTISTLMNTLWIDPLEERSNELLNFQAMIEQTIDIRSLEEATSASSMNSMSMIAINPEYDENLMAIRKKLDRIKSLIKEVHSDTGDDLNMELDKKLKLEDHHVHGWCFRLTRNDASCLRGNKKYKELSTVKAGVFFTTAELSQASTDIKKLQEDYEKFQKDIVNEIIETAATYSPIFTKVSMCLNNLDVLISLAHASAFAPIPYTRPTKLHGIHDTDRSLKLIEARHPCLEQQDNLTFISNDIEMHKDKSEFLIITGPNMGGKSTYIRTVGVIALMNQIGCFIPTAEDSEICIFDSILARVGASDSQLKGVSTFMSEMLEMSCILKTATENSLIIVDELGRGTSTYDGFGLAWSISEFISTKIKAFTLFATHFHELTTLADQIPSVQNLHVVAHVEKMEDQNQQCTDDNITLLYKVEPGISDQSFGIHVAELVKFPQKIIEMSKRKALELDDSKSSEEIRAKRAKFSNEEVLGSKELFVSILKKWKDNVDGKGGVDALGSEEVIGELKRLVNEEYHTEFTNDRVLQEMLRL